MDFIEEKYTAVCFFQQAGPVRICASVGALFRAHKLAYEELGIIGVISTVKNHKRCIVSEVSAFTSIMVNHFCKH